ncbi:MAG: cobalt-precorrin-7 (C(5))-methyltransferase, partial [Streptococcus sanguinis]|nr:cobalt-precorrin-7 (C(5))-methyltransferase [Streptococcus sanguinis]
MDMIYVIGIGPGDPSYGLLGQEAYFEKADRILGSERHLEILPPAYKDKGLVPPKKLAALAELLESFGEDEEILYLASGDPLIYGLGKWLSEKFKGRVVISPGISAMQYLASRIALPM